MTPPAVLPCLRPGPLPLCAAVSSEGRRSGCAWAFLAPFLARRWAAPALASRRCSGVVVLVAHCVGARFAFAQPVLPYGGAPAGAIPRRSSEVLRCAPALPRSGAPGALPVLPPPCLLFPTRLCFAAQWPDVARSSLRGRGPRRRSGWMVLAAPRRPPVGAAHAPLLPAPSRPALCPSASASASVAASPALAVRSSPASVRQPPVGWGAGLVAAVAFAPSVMACWRLAWRALLVNGPASWSSAVRLPAGPCSLLHARSGSRLAAVCARRPLARGRLRPVPPLRAESWPGPGPAHPHPPPAPPMLARPSQALGVTRLLVQRFLRHPTTPAAAVIFRPAVDCGPLVLVGRSAGRALALTRWSCPRGRRARAAFVRACFAAAGFVILRASRGCPMPIFAGISPIHLRWGSLRRSAPLPWPLLAQTPACAPLPPDSAPSAHSLRPLVVAR